MHNCIRALLVAATSLAIAGAATVNAQQAPPVEAAKGHARAVLDVALSPDASTFATVGSEGSIWIWQTDALRVVQQLDTPDVFYARYSAKGDRLAALTKNKLLSWPTDAWQAERPVSHPPLHSTSHVLTSDLSVAYIRGLLGVARWQIPDVNNMSPVFPPPATPQRPQTLGGVACFAVSNNDQTVVVAMDAWDQGHLAVWDARRQKTIKEISRVGPSITSVAVSPDSKLIACCTKGVVKLYDAKTGKLNGSTPGDLASFSSSSNQIAVVKKNNAKCEIEIWNTANAKVIRTLECDAKSLSAIEFSEDGEFLLAGGTHANNSGAVYLWNLKTGKQLLSSFGEAVQEQPPVVARPPLQRIERPYFIVTGLDHQAPSKTRNSRNPVPPRAVCEECYQKLKESPSFRLISRNTSARKSGSTVDTGDNRRYARAVEFHLYSSFPGDADLSPIAQSVLQAKIPHQLSLQLYLVVPFAKAPPARSIAQIKALPAVVAGATQIHGKELHIKLSGGGKVTLEEVQKLLGG